MSAPNASTALLLVKSAVSTEEGGGGEGEANPRWHSTGRSVWNHAGPDLQR